MRRGPAINGLVVVVETGRAAAVASYRTKNEKSH
jgi:hypothetical protein